MQALTPRQAQILEYIQKRLEKGSPPSQREIAGHFTLAQNAAYQLVAQLRRKGYVVQTPGHRGLRLSETYRKAGAGGLSPGPGLPLLGRVAAGEPILAEQNVDETVDLNAWFARPGGDTFLVKVVGDSMVDEGILNGDYVVVRRQERLDSGEIAVVLVEDEVTVKRVFLRPKGLELRPANRRAGYRSRVVGADDKTVRIVGKVIGCIRQIS